MFDLMAQTEGLLLINKVISNTMYWAFSEMCWFHPSQQQFHPSQQHKIGLYLFKITHTRPVYTYYEITHKIGLYIL